MVKKFVATHWSPSAVPANDFRVDYLEEARDCLRASNRILTRYPNEWQSIPEFWANLLGAIANGNIAAVSEDVARGLTDREATRAEEQKRIRDLLLDDKTPCRTTAG